MAKRRRGRRPRRWRARRREATSTRRREAGELSFALLEMWSRGLPGSLREKISRARRRSPTPLIVFADRLGSASRRVRDSLASLAPPQPPQLARREDDREGRRHAEGDEGPD